MDSQSMSRAVMSAGLWFGVSYGLGMAFGVRVNPVDVAIDSALLGGSALASDMLHTSLGMPPSAVSSAVATGALYAGTQKLYRGSDAYLTNAVVAGANDYAIEAYQSSQRQSMIAEAMAGSDDYDE